MDQATQPRRDYTFLLDRLLKEVKDRNLAEARECAQLAIEKLGEARVRIFCNQSIGTKDRAWLGTAIQKPRAGSKEVALGMLDKLVGQKVRSRGPLTAEERHQKQFLLGQIEKHMAQEIEMGKCFALIRDLQLYREGYTTFKDFCREHLGMDTLWPYRLIDAYETCQKLSEDLPRPHCEKTCRPLTNKKFTKVDIETIWGNALRIHGKRPRKEHVEEQSKIYRNRMSEQAPSPFEVIEPGSIVEIVENSKGAGFAPKGHWARVEEPETQDPNAQKSKIYLHIWNKRSWIARSKVRPHPNFEIPEEHVDAIFGLSESMETFKRDMALAFFSVTQLDDEKRRILQEFADCASPCLP